MVLSQAQLREEVSRGKLVFSPPIEEIQWGPTSIDLRLGFSFTMFKTVEELKGLTVSVADGLKTIAATKPWITKELKEKDEFGKHEYFQLDPNDFVLAFTYETVTVPNHLIGLIEGRSTYARMGLSMHQTAPWIHPGFSAPITLEIRNSDPLTIRLAPLIDRPCQITFFELTSPVEDAHVYGAKATDIYQHQEHPLDPKESG